MRWRTWRWAEGEDPVRERDIRLRENGLPVLVPLRRWHHGLLWRMAPALTWILLVGIGIGNLERVVLHQFASAEQQLGDEGIYLELGYWWAVVAAGIAVPLLVSVLLARWLRRRPGARIPVGAVVLLLYVIAWFVGLFVRGSDPLWMSVIVQPILLVVTALACWAGLGSALSWSLRVTREQAAVVMASASRALPVIMLVVIFGFYSAETWQMTDELSGARFVAFFAAAGLIALVTTTPQAIRELRELREKMEDDPGLSDWHGLSGLVRHAREGNIYLVLALTQLVQGALFFLLFAAMMLGLGQITLPDAVAQKWLGHPVTPAMIGGTELPVSLNLLKAVAFIAIVAMLAYLIGAATDLERRAELFDPLIERMHDLLTEDPDPVAHPGPIARPAPAAHSGPAAASAAPAETADPSKPPTDAPATPASPKPPADA